MFGELNEKQEELSVDWRLVAGAFAGRPALLVFETLWAFWMDPSRVA